MKITLPVSGKEVELAVWPWDKAKSFFPRAAAFLKDGHSNDEWMEHVLTESYPPAVLEDVFLSAPDAVALYNDTLRYNKNGPEAVKNSLRSGNGQQTQTA